MTSAASVVLAASADSGGGSTDWPLYVSLLLGGIGTTLGVLNAYHSVTDRRARIKPDVHGVVMGNPGKSSVLAFVNAGQGVARSVQYLFYEEPFSVMGGPGAAFLLSEEQREVPLPFEVKELQSMMVWLYMDVEGRVYGRSNHGKHKEFPKGVTVSLRATFEEMYPDVELPAGKDQYVGE